VYAILIITRKPKQKFFISVLSFKKWGAKKENCNEKIFCFGSAEWSEVSGKARRYHGRGAGFKA